MSDPLDLAKKVQIAIERNERHEVRIPVDEYTPIVLAGIFSALLSIALDLRELRERPFIQRGKD